MIRPDHRPGLALLAALFLAGCASSPMSRIDANRALYESWPFEVQEAVLNGRVMLGMTPDMVSMVLGKPSEVMSRSGKKGEEEVWIYRTSTGGGMSNVLQGTSISVGGGIGGVGVSAPIPIGGGGGGSEPVEDERDVVFQNGVVIRADPGLSGIKK